MRSTIRMLLIVSAILSLSAAAFAEESNRITSVVKIVKEWAPSVVNISTERIMLLRTHPFWNQFGTMIDQSNNQNMMIGTMKLKSVGSGVVISPSGLILTNAHVVQMASTIYVILKDGKEVEAKVETTSPEDDLALIRITPPEELKPVKIADDAMIGETAIAIGNPLGFENSVSVGVISGLNRNLLPDQKNPVLTGLIQTDAPINQGSSGGALFNLDGQLVGINLAVVQNVNSIGFAIPYNKIKRILKDYADGKTASPKKEEAKANPSKEEAPSVVNVIKIPVE